MQYTHMYIHFQYIKKMSISHLLERGCSHGTHQEHSLTAHRFTVSLHLSGEDGWLVTGVSLVISPGGEPGCELVSSGLTLAF